MQFASTTRKRCSLSPSMNHWFSQTCTPRHMTLCVSGVLRALWACVHVHGLQRVTRYVSTMQPADQGQSEGVFVDVTLEVADPDMGHRRLGNSAGALQPSVQLGGLSIEAGL